MNPRKETKGKMIHDANTSRRHPSGNATPPPRQFGYGGRIGCIGSALGDKVNPRSRKEDLQIDFEFVF
jgi:hypothetical protein